MEKLTHKGKSCKKVHGDDSTKSHTAWEDEQRNKEETNEEETNEEETNEEETNEEQELDELVDYDGSLLSSKIPLGINKTNKISRSTSDDVVKTSHQKGNGMGYYYKRYWGEAYELGGLGREHPSEVSPEKDIALMTADETIDHFEDEYELSSVKAQRKASEAGKFVDGSEEELHSEKQRIIELGNNKMKDMLEILLSKDDRNEQGLVNTGKKMELLDDEVSNPILNRMGDKFKRACDAQGVNPQDILKNI